jgi:hypothetical protein
MMMRKIVIAAVIMVIVSASSGSAFADCCHEGCCDCGCVSLKAQKKAARLASLVRRHLGGNLTSFTFDASDKKPLDSLWTCSMQGETAVCKRK